MIWNIGFIEGSCKWRLMAAFVNRKEYFMAIRES